ncbi:unnamed protein product [Amoebophrya sp. A25]|nr:unnamed protein product [Amoebophrya sp. A25]|eukprot:GSA25T00004737001.1
MVEKGTQGDSTEDNLFNRTSNSYNGNIFNINSSLVTKLILNQQQQEDLLRSNSTGTDAPSLLEQCQQLTQEELQQVRLLYQH